MAVDSHAVTTATYHDTITDIGTNVERRDVSEMLDLWARAAVEAARARIRPPGSSDSAVRLRGYAPPQPAVLPIHAVPAWY